MVVYSNNYYIYIFFYFGYFVVILNPLCLCAQINLLISLAWETWRSTLDKTPLSSA